MKTLVAIPCMDMVHTVFLRSILGLNKGDGEVRFAISCSSLIYDARNTLVKQAMTEGYDRILWLDSDMDFQPDLLMRLSAHLDNGLDLVSGIYFKRKAPVSPVIYSEVGYFTNPENSGITPTAVSYDDYPRDSLFKIKACGFGGVMMTVDLARRVTEKFGLPFAPMLGFGEDLSFCGRVTNLGVDMWCDSSIKLGHVGQGTITEDTYFQQIGADKNGG